MYSDIKLYEDLAVKAVDASVKAVARAKQLTADAVSAAMEAEKLSKRAKVALTVYREAVLKQEQDDYTKALNTVNQPEPNHWRNRNA